MGCRVLHTSHIRTKHHLLLLSSNLFLCEQLLHTRTTLREMDRQLVGVLVLPTEHLHHRLVLHLLSLLLCFLIGLVMRGLIHASDLVAFSDLLIPILSSITLGVY